MGRGPSPGARPRFRRRLGGGCEGPGSRPTSPCSSSPGRIAGPLRSEQARRLCRHRPRRCDLLPWSDRGPAAGAADARALVRALFRLARLRCGASPALRGVGKRGGCAVIEAARCHDRYVAFRPAGRMRGLLYAHDLALLVSVVAPHKPFVEWATGAALPSSLSPPRPAAMVATWPRSRHGAHAQPRARAPSPIALAHALSMAPPRHRVFIFSAQSAEHTPTAVMDTGKSTSSRTASSRAGARTRTWRKIWTACTM